MTYHPKLKTLVPLEDLEREAQDQIWKQLVHDFLVKMAIMPDCHTGYTLPIGGVALLDGVISPEYVGYDIGCGMSCAILSVNASYIKNDLKDIFDEIYRKIPVGFNTHSRKQDYPEFISASGDKNLNDKVNAKTFVQLGTLGSGNHFIELGETINGMLAVTIHSGSRNPGHSIAGHYMKLSKTVDTHLPAGFLDLKSITGMEYLQDCNWALNYALENRKRMLKVIVEEVLQLELWDFINENHNHLIVQRDARHVLHRKGATPADKGQLGVIPGNMRDGVYITKGLGNNEYLSSASHGAGRKMSRKKAKETILLEDFERVMRDANVVAKVDQGTLDEAPFAYKSVAEVVAIQDGVVIEVIDHVKPLINVKG